MRTNMSLDAWLSSIRHIHTYTRTTRWLLYNTRLTHSLAPSDTLEGQLFSHLWGFSLGMVYLHQVGIIHCDLKTSNLLVDKNWKVSVADFGLSLLTSEAQKGQRGTLGCITIPPSSFCCFHTYFISISSYA